MIDRSRVTWIRKENGASWKEGYRLVYDGWWRTSRNARPRVKPNLNQATDPGTTPRAPALARSLWARNIETQDVLLCHPRAGDLLVMNIVAHGGTWPARPRGVLPKYVRRLAYWTSFLLLLHPPPRSLHAAIFILKCHVNHRRTRGHITATRV